MHQVEDCTLGCGKGGSHQFQVFTSFGLHMGLVILAAVTFVSECIRIAHPWLINDSEQTIEWEKIFTFRIR